jgi:hypothetical protein
MEENKYKKTSFMEEKKLFITEILLKVAEDAITLSTFISQLMIPLTA